MNDESRLLAQIDETTDLAERAFAAGDVAGGIAAIALAAQLVQLARLLQPINSGGLPGSRRR